MSGAARLLAAGVLLALAAWVANAAFYVVPQQQQALVVRFGRPVAVIREPSLQLRVPFIDAVAFTDNRLLLLQPPADQIILGDQKRIEVETYSQFRIADPLRYYQTVGTEEQARSQLSQMVSSSLRRALGQVQLPALLSADRTRVTQAVLHDVAEAARTIGIEVEDVRIRRADLPVETSQAIYDRMTSERNREAKELRAEGFEWAQRIRAKAEHDRTVLLSEAQRQANVARGEGEAEASRVAAAAYGKDPGFYELYRTLQAYRTGLEPGTPTLVLSPANPFMRYLGGSGAETDSAETGRAEAGR